MANVNDLRRALDRAAKCSNLEPEDSGALFADFLEFYLTLLERLSVPQSAAGAESGPEASPFPEFELTDVPGPERAPIPEPARELGVELLPEDVPTPEPNPADVPACFHCNTRPAMYCKDCYHERFDRKTEMGTAHKSPSGFALLSTRWCTQDNHKRDGFETVDAVVTSWAQSQDGATFFVFERVESEATGTYRAYVYAKAGG